MIATTLIEIPSWGSASLIEIVWLFTGLAVVLFSTLGIPEAVNLWKVAIYQGDELMITIASGYVRREAIRTFNGLVISGIGLYACLAGQSRPGPVVVSPVGLVLTSGLLLIGFLIALQSVLDRAQQRRVAQILEQQTLSAPEPLLKEVV